MIARCGPAVVNLYPYIYACSVFVLTGHYGFSDVLLLAWSKISFEKKWEIEKEIFQESNWRTFFVISSFIYFFNSEVQGTAIPIIILLSNTEADRKKATGNLKCFQKQQQK